MTMRNPARAARGDFPSSAYLTPDHADTVSDDVRRVAATPGERLGTGNFGTTYRVGGYVVKRPNTEDIHGRPWDMTLLREYFIHEAGVSNELHEVGYRVVPRTVFVDLPGTFALVREYGEIADPLTPSEYADLERGLYTMEDGTDFRVRDEILPLRRPDGSIFVGDVGWWITGRARESDLGMLLGRLAEQTFGHRIPMPDEITSYRRTIEFFTGEDDAPIFVRRTRERLAAAVEERRRLGLPLSY